MRSSPLNLFASLALFATAAFAATAPETTAPATTQSVDLASLRAPAVKTYVTVLTGDTLSPRLDIGVEARHVTPLLLSALAEVSPARVVDAAQPDARAATQVASSAASETAAALPASSH